MLYHVLPPPEACSGGCGVQCLLPHAWDTTTLWAAFLGQGIAEGVINVGKQAGGNRGLACSPTAGASRRRRSPGSLVVVKVC